MVKLFFTYKVLIFVLQPLLMSNNDCIENLRHENVLHALRSGDKSLEETVFSCLHEKYYAAFTTRLPVKVNTLSAEILEQVAEEIFNDALIQLRSNIRSSLYNESMGDYAAYLYGIYKMLFLNAYRKELTKKIYHSSYDKIKQTYTVYEAAISFKNNEEDVYTLLRIAIAKQNIPCQKMLHSDIFTPLTDDAASTALNYKTAESYRSARSRCRKDLLETLTKDFGFNFN